MKTATQTPAQCEAAIGPRGNVVVTIENRREVRKWLNAQGFPALFSGGLSMRELQMAYNDTSGQKVAALRRKLDEASEGLRSDTPTLDDVAATIEASQTSRPAPATPTPTQGMSLQDMIAGTENRPRPQPQNELEAEAANEGRPHKANGKDTGQDDVAEAAKRLAEAIAAREGKASPVDAEAVKKIVQDEMKGFDKKLRDLTTTRIEVKLPDSDTVTALEGQHHPQFETLLQAAASREVSGFHPNIMLSGPAGSGKTFAAKNVIKALGLDFEYNGALSMAHEVLGYQDAAGTYHPTSFFRGYTGKAGYVFDEVDGSDNSPLLALNAALANGTASFPHGNHQRHPDSLIIATANTWGLGATADYVGRSKLDAAFLSRFPVRLYWDYDEKLEQAICGNEEWARRVQKARAQARKAGIKVIICPRISIAGAALLKAGMSADRVATITYLANLTPEQRGIIEAPPR